MVKIPSLKVLLLPFLLSWFMTKFCKTPEHARIYYDNPVTLMTLPLTHIITNWQVKWYQAIKTIGYYTNNLVRSLHYSFKYLSSYTCCNIPSITNVLVSWLSDVTVLIEHPSKGLN